MAAPRVMSYDEFQRYAAQQQAPQPQLPPVPPPVGPPSLLAPPPLTSHEAAQPLPYDPNAAPTRSWDLAPINIITPMDPYKDLPLEEIPAARAWRRAP